MTPEQLAAIASKLADEARKLGVRGVVIGVSSDDDDGHSAFWVAHRGPCLEIEGLAARVEAYAAKLWDGKIGSSTRLPSGPAGAAGGSCVSGGGSGAR
jgi:hypothetical protein